MQPGKLNKRLTIQQSVPTSPAQDGFGAPQEAWTELDTVWGAVEPLQGREFWAQQQVQSEVTLRIRIRYLSTVTTKMRILHGSKTYIIKSIIDPKEKHEEMQLMCAEGVRDG